MKYVLYTAVLRAVTLGHGPASQFENEVCETLLSCLARTDIPFEPSHGVFGRARRLYRDSVSVRYPRYDGAYGQTFWYRLYKWMRRAAATKEGREALDAAGFAPGEEGEHHFATRVVGETYGLLLEPFFLQGSSQFRQQMADAVDPSLSSMERRQKLERVQAAIQAMAAGVAGITISELGFHNNLAESLGFGAVALAATGAIEVTRLSGRTISPKVLAARRRARQWLLTLGALLERYVVWENRQLENKEDGDVDSLLQLVAALSKSEAHFQDLPVEQLLRGLDRVRVVADSAGDDELSAALTDLETAIEFDLDLLPQYVGQLISLIRSAPSSPGPSELASRPDLRDLEGRGGRRELER